MMRKAKGHAISGAFVFMLLGVFAVFSTVLVLLGAQAYRSTVERTTEHSQTRLLQSLIRHAVRAEDASGAVSVFEEGGMQVLCIADDPADEETYATLIYVYEGTLRELYTEAQGEFVPARGEVICTASSFHAQIDGGRLAVEIADENGNVSQVTVAVYCSEVAP